MEDNMKLYSGMTRRLFKKKVGKSYKLLIYSQTLKAGDLIFCCSGYNKRIKELVPCCSYFKNKGFYIYDFDVILEDDARCSLVHCCEPALSKEKIIAFWKSMYFMFAGFHCILSERVRNGLEIVDEEGQLLKELK